MYNYIDNFIKHLENKEQEQLQLPPGERNILAPCTDAQMVVDCMIECFLGNDWYINYPCGNGQVNTEACFEILYKHSKKFRKYIKNRRKKK